MVGRPFTITVTPGSPWLLARSIIFPEIVRFCAWACGGDFGLESKKLPPPPNIFDEDVAGGDFVLEKLSRPENGDGFGAGAALKERLPKASFMPPKADC